MNQETFQKADKLLNEINALEGVQLTIGYTKANLMGLSCIQQLMKVNPVATGKFIDKICNDIVFPAKSLEREKIADFEKLGV